MLKSLNIENVAVIEKADIEFNRGLNVLTGETGAGKSIIVDSINAVLGERTSKELVRHGAESAVVSAYFEDIGKDVEKILDGMGIDSSDGELLISRKISASGKSSCKLNGSACTASMIREISSSLVNIHGQHDSQALLNPDYHYKFIDKFAEDNNYGLTEYKESFSELIKVRRRLKALTLDADAKDRQLELLNYEINELEGAEIKIGEREKLKSRRLLIQNSQNVISALNAVSAALSGDDEISGVETALKSCEKEIESVSALDSGLKTIGDKLRELIDSSESLKDAVSAKLALVDFSEAELEAIEERLDMYYRFSNKYGDTEEEMLSFLEDAKERRNSIVNSDEELERLNAEYDRLYEETLKRAQLLSDNRRKTAKKLEAAVYAQLKELDMPKIQFVTDFKKGNLSSNGYDRIEFLISTNPGEPPKPLSKIASGGELSRIMLAIKSVIAEKDTVGTLIFDEIDSGVSGKASRKIGYSLKGVAEFTQVLCVTHSAQIASLADSHLLISKSFENGRTYTSVRELDENERKQELARIMGGIEITDTILRSAEELLKGN